MERLKFDLLRFWPPRAAYKIATCRKTTVAKMRHDLDSTKSGATAAKPSMRQRHVARSLPNARSNVAGAPGAGPSWGEVGGVFVWQPDLPRLR
jgi:hypothetical protein